MALSFFRASTCTQPLRVARHKLRPETLISCRYESTSTASEPPLFPWRHSPESILRVVEEDNLSGLPVDKQKDTFFQQVMLGSMLQRDWHELLLPSIWKESLANDCAWAFQKGLASLLSRVFRVPIDDIDKEDMGIIFDTEHMNVEEEEKAPDNEDSKETSEKDATNETNEEQDEVCSLRLEKRLIELYANVDPTTTDLSLCMKPLSSKLENVFSVIFTRDTVQEDASLAEAGRKMRYESRVARNPLEVSRILKELDQKKKPIALFTIIADVSIHCLEAFCVKDKSTGAIVNGSTDPQEVTHLVRFEVTTNLDGRHLGSWRIVDWDDLLEGNVWY